MSATCVYGFQQSNSTFVIRGREVISPDNTIMIGRSEISEACSTAFQLLTIDITCLGRFDAYSIIQPIAIVQQRSIVAHPTMPRHVDGRIIATYPITAGESNSGSLRFDLRGFCYPTTYHGTQLLTIGTPLYPEDELCVETQYELKVRKLDPEHSFAHNNNTVVGESDAYAFT